MSIPQTKTSLSARDHTPFNTSFIIEINLREKCVVVCEDDTLSPVSLQRNDALKQPLFVTGHEKLNSCSAE